MSSCQPSNTNLPIYFQSVKPFISPVQFENKILYATTGSLPSSSPLNRIFTFICNGTFTGRTCSVVFDASTLIKECSQYNITFEGEIYGQLTIQNQDFQLQKYISKQLLYDASGRVYGIRFRIAKPNSLPPGKKHEFYFNILLNDRDFLV